MDFNQFIIMKHELLLTITVMVLLVAELAINDKKRIIPIAISLFGLHTALGFFWNESGALFGGMYQTSGLIILMKNILNVGVFIVLLQSANWLRKPENINKISEYFILLFLYGDMCLFFLYPLHFGLGRHLPCFICRYSSCRG